MLLSSLVILIEHAYYLQLILNLVFLPLFFSISPSNLCKSTFSRTSNSLAFYSSSSSLLLLLVLYYINFYFSCASALTSSLSLSIIFSWLAISCWDLSSSCFKIFSRFSDSASYSQRQELLVSYCFRLSILKSCFYFVQTSLSLLSILYFLIVLWSKIISSLASFSLSFNRSISL